MLNPIKVIGHLRNLVSRRSRNIDVTHLEKGVPAEWLHFIDEVEREGSPPALAGSQRVKVSSSGVPRRESMAGRDHLMPEEGDPCEDGHPCEAALEFRRLLRCWGLADELPADVIDLCVALAWIGKAVSRTQAVYEFREMGIDPNTWQIIAGMATEQVVASRALQAASLDPADSRRGMELALVRQSEGFRNAYEAVARILSHASDGSSASRRWKYLRQVSHGMVDIDLPKPTTDIIDLASVRRRKGKVRSDQG